jgi:O-acetylserine/cysteine efflux transporter
VLGLTLIASVCYVAIKAGLAYAPPLYFGGLRGLIAGVALLVLAGALGRPVLLDRHLRLGTLALALTATTLTYGGMFLSPGRAGAGIATVLGNVQPLLAVALAAVFLEERITRAKAVALLLGLAGVVLVTYPGLRESSTRVGVGGLLALGASLGSAVGSVISKRLALRSALLAVTGWQFVLGSVPLLAAAAVLEPVSGTTWNAKFVTLLLFLALVGTAFSTAAWFWLLQRDDVSRLSLLLFGAPVLGLGLAVAAFGERIEPVEGVGASMIGVSILAVLRGGRSGGVSRPEKEAP